MSREDIIIPVEKEALLLQFLLQHLKQKSRDNVKSMLRYRQVWVDGRAVSQFNHPLRPGQQITIKKDRQTDANLNRYFRIVFEDEYIVVIDKQAGLLSISAGSEHLTAYGLLSSYLKQKDPAGKIFVVHRLDRDTSGVMIFAKSEQVQTLLQKTWQTGIHERTYVALVEGKVEKSAGTIRSYLTESKAFVVHSSKDPDKGELAITHFRTLKSNPDYSLLEVSLETGKKNQIRVHMQDIGHSIVGDKKYGANGNPIGRLGLHASLLTLTHPVSGEHLRFASDTPARFLRVF